MGPLQRNGYTGHQHHAREQTTLWRKKNKELLSFLYKVPLSCLPSSKEFLCWMWLLLCKEPILYHFVTETRKHQTWLLLGTRMTKRARPAWVSTRTTFKKDKYELVSTKVHEHLWQLAHAPQPWASSGARILLKKPALQTKPLHFMVVVVSSNTAASYWPYSSFFR